ncbi:MAG: prepilin-type N-terminal cleavage/methylation domain-containing protein [Pirellulales bacterium]
MTNQNRRGVTLVELLIVIALITLLAALTLPTLRQVLKHSQVPQAARMVEAYAESAKSRAIASGRRVALVIERARADAGGGVGSDALIANETSTHLSIAEVFPPYEGDWAGSTATPVSVAGSGYVDAIDIPVAQAATLLDLNQSPPVPNGFVSLGALVQLGDRSQGFIVSGTPSITLAGNIRIPLANAPSIALPGTGYAAQSNEAMWPLTQEMADNGVRFKIFRLPSKTMSGSVTLPRGTCIDISCSGVGPAGRDFSADAISSGAGIAASAGDYGPIFIVFNPRGSVDIAYFQGRVSNGSGGYIPGLRRVLPTGVLHFLIGRTEQVQPSNLLAPYSGGQISSRDDFTSNLNDASNYWLSLNPYSGNIYTSPVTAVAAPQNPMTVASRLIEARSNATVAVSSVGY